ncbi:SO_0444 family Cu/Zn efflux transporter [Marinomonas sp. C2222]|uniref:SO_0444 family Cu/Zn efflux transporter n=1 Tax=Marinomonas sargassi TaxID=2984494 RepID=A0ABT2YRM9_9GAMM|nr:SO_0444 family Cu/Zn efflux transporter [Marinomonas sargassi]MCV2402531.1 SO_0444 family Cu/Zn efflux transporter [Marinomonas sargassi]
MIMEFIGNFFELFMESAPYLLIGLFIAGIIKQAVPESWIQKVLGKDSSVTTAALIGAPIPLCSCSVIPTAMGIRRAGASKASTASFMVATPETGVDSIGITLALMNPIMAIARPISAIASAIVAGKLVQVWDKETPAGTTETDTKVSSCCSNQKTAEPSVKAETTGCCSSKQAKAEPDIKTETVSCCSSKSNKPKPAVKAETSSCCSSKQEKAEPAIKPETASCCGTQSAPEDTIVTKVGRAIKYGYGKLLSDFMTWLLIGLFFAAIIKTFVPTDFFLQYGTSVWAMLVIILISIPMYICATASTPIAAGLMLSGISPGAALVFMLAGPATNIATLMVVKNELGNRSLAAYLVGVIATAIASGLILDWLVKYFDWSMQVNAGHHHPMTDPLYIASAIVLAGLIGFQYMKKYTRNRNAI